MSLLDKIVGKVDILSVHFTDKDACDMTLLQCRAADMTIISEHDHYAITPQSELGKRPLFVALSGNGVISKATGELSFASTQNLLLYTSTDGIDAVVRAERYDMVVKLLDVVGATPLGVIVTAQPNKEVLCREAAAMWRTNAKWRNLMRLDSRSNALCRVVVGRIAAPLLVVLLATLAANYFVNSSIREEYIATQTILRAYRQKSVDSSDKSSLEFSAGEARTSFAVLCDKIGRCTPPEITLTSLIVQPVKGKVESGRKVEVAQGTTEVRGTCRSSDYISQFTSSLKQVESIGTVKLTALERDKESGLLNFKIELTQ